MTLEEKIRAAIERHPDWDDRRIASATRGATMAAVKIVREGGSVPEPPNAPAEAKAAGTITLDAVKARYDVAAAIRRELALLKPGVLVLESEMRVRAAGKDANRFRRAVENTEEFKAHRVKLQLDPDGGEAAWYWGDASTVAAAIKVRDSI